MKKKKIVKVLVIIILVMLAAFLINLGRKTYIIAAYNTNTKQQAYITNYYKKMIEDETIVEFWRKDNVAIYKRTSFDGIRMICNGEENNWIIVNTRNEDGKETKTAVNMGKGNTVPSMMSLNICSLPAEGFFETLTVAFLTRITTEKVGNVNCYKIWVSDDFQLFLDQENYLKVKEINGNTGADRIEYELNTVTDEDVKLPDLQGYEIKQAE